SLSRHDGRWPAQFYPVVYRQAVKKRQYVTPITPKCFFDVTKCAFVCYSERYRAFVSLNESVRG
ncbi:hypothetical protein FPK47_20600, partial [Acinetobacter baumannii]|nr:hypothetical protein [Acinetobacter baumannii]